MCIIVIIIFQKIKLLKNYYFYSFTFIAGEAFHRFIVTFKMIGKEIKPILVLKLYIQLTLQGTITHDYSRTSVGIINSIKDKIVNQGIFN